MELWQHWPLDDHLYPQSNSPLIHPGGSGAAPELVSRPQSCALPGHWKDCLLFPRPPR